MCDHSGTSVEMVVSANSADDASRFHAQRHWRPYTEVPLASPRELIPMADAGDMNINDQFFRLWITGRIQFEARDRIREGLDPRGVHANKLEALVVGCNQPTINTRLVRQHTFRLTNRAVTARRSPARWSPASSCSISAAHNVPAGASPTARSGLGANRR